MSYPHLEDLPDSAYHQPTHAPVDHRDYNERTRRYEPDPYETDTPDEISGYNWGPPPDPHYDPSLREHEVDTHHDPDHGYEEHRVGAILRQAEQYPHYDDYGPEENDWEHQREHEARVLMPSRTGLEHPVIARRNPKNDGWDILAHLD